MIAQLSSTKQRCLTNLFLVIYDELSDSKKTKTNKKEGEKTRLIVSFSK